MDGWMDGWSYLGAFRMSELKEGERCNINRISFLLLQLGLTWLQLGFAITGQCTDGRKSPTHAVHSDLCHLESRIP